MPKALDHIVLNVEDIDSMLNFYVEVLDLHSERLKEFRTGKVPFPSVRIEANSVIDLFPSSLWKEDREKSKGYQNLNHFCLAMNRGEWDDLRKRLDDRNIVIEEGPVSRWGALGTGISIYFRDPEGNLIEVRYYEKENSSRPCLLGT